MSTDHRFYVDADAAAPVPAVSYATARSLAIRVLALAEAAAAFADGDEPDELLEHTTTLASLLAGDRVQLEVHVGVTAGGFPTNCHADAPVALVVKEYVAPPTDPVLLGDLVLDDAGHLAIPHILSTGHGVALRRDPAAYALRGAETLLDDPARLRFDVDAKQAASDEDPAHTPDVRARVVALLRAHGVPSLADDVERADNGARLALIAQLGLNSEAITETQAILLGLLAIVTDWLAPTCERTFRGALTTLLDRVERATPTRRPSFTIAPDDVLATVVADLGIPEFGKRENGTLVDVTPGESAGGYLEAAIAARAVIAPAGHRAVVEGDDDGNGSWLKVSVARDARRPQLTWGWEEIKHLPVPDEDADPVAALRELLDWAVSELNSLLLSA